VPEVLEILDSQVDMVLEQNPNVIGISCFSLDQVPVALALAQRIREREGGVCRIVLGGAAMSYVSAEDLLGACLSVDGVVRGEGELALEALGRGASAAHVPGLVHRAGAGIARNAFPSTLSLNALRAPDFSRLRLEDAFNPEPVLPVLFSRGCRWRRCRFCAHNRSFAGYRSRDPQAFVTELEGLRDRFGTYHFYFADQYVDPVALEVLSREIIARRLDVNWHVMGRPTADYTPERLALFARAGCRWISWGVETGSPRLLELIGKGTNAGTMRRVIQDAARCGIANLLMMIFGLPTGTDEDLLATFGFVEDVHDATHAMTASTFTLWEGTHFARNAARYGLAPEGRGVLLRVRGVPIHEFRVDFREVAGDGSLRPPRGPHEVGSWMARKRWLGSFGFLENTPTEHFLLFASRRVQGPQRPRALQPRAA
jgi:radical SAM superfamily enzyme YgiQ (UPF0313 family)